MPFSKAIKRVRISAASRLMLPFFSTLALAQEVPDQPGGSPPADVLLPGQLGPPRAGQPDSWVALGRGQELLRKECPIPESEPADWIAAQQHLEEALSKKQTLKKLLAQAKKAPPQNAQEALFQLAIMLRAKEYEEVKRLLAFLAKRPVSPEFANFATGSSTGQRSYQSLASCILATGKTDLAVALVESTSVNLDGRGFSVEEKIYPFLKRKGFDFSALDAWLAERCRREFAEAPHGRSAFFFRSENSWFARRAQHQRAAGLGKAFAQELQEYLRGYTEKDRWQSLTLLLNITHDLPQEAAALEWDWLREAHEPKYPSEAGDFAYCLLGLRAWKTARYFLEQAQALPFTDLDYWRIAAGMAVHCEPDTIKQSFEENLGNELFRCLCELGDAEAAAKFLREHPKTRFAMGAEYAEGRTGITVIEDFIRAQEAARKDDFVYWMERASYYHIRNSAGVPGGLLGPEETEAWDRVLPLVRKITLPDREQASAIRRAVLGHMEYLKAKDREAAHKFAVTETKQDSLIGRTVAERLPEMLLDFRRDHPAMWSWLELRKEWNHIEERLLQAILLRTGTDLSVLRPRAEELAKKEMATRGEVMGKILLWMQYPERAQPFLKAAKKLEGP